VGVDCFDPAAKSEHEFDGSEWSSPITHGSEHSMPVSAVSEQATRVSVRFDSEESLGLSLGCERDGFSLTITRIINAALITKVCVFNAYVFPCLALSEF
jgi:hypothetical protein